MCQVHVRLCPWHRTQSRPGRRGGKWMGVSNAYVTVNTGASHQRGYTVNNTSHPVGCDVSEKLARIMRCNSILSCMPDAACPCTRFQRRGCATPCAAGGCTHDAGTHCRGARPPWVRRAWGEQRALRGCDALKKQACKMKCDSCTICMPDTGMQNEV